MIFTIWSEQLRNLVRCTIIRQRAIASQCMRKRWSLERADKSRHRIAPAPMSILPDLNRRKKDAGRHGDSIDQIGERADIHVSEDRLRDRGKGIRRSGRAESRRGTGDRLLPRSALALVRPLPSLSSWPLPWRRRLRFLFHPQR